jgi:hypothetical protein
MKNKENKEKIFLKVNKKRRETEKDKFLIKRMTGKRKNEKNTYTKKSDI